MRIGSGEAARAGAASSRGSTSMAHAETGPNLFALTVSSPLLRVSMPRPTLSRLFDQRHRPDGRSGGAAQGDGEPEEGEAWRGDPIQVREVLNVMVGSTRQELMVGQVLVVDIWRGAVQAEHDHPLVQHPLHRVGADP